MRRIFLFVCLSFQIFGQTQRIIALRVAFKADQSEFTTGNGLFDFRSDMPADSIQSIVIDPPPHNRSYFEDHLLFAKNYFKKTLNTNIDYSVYPSAENAFFQLSKKMFHYNPNTAEDSLKGIIELYTESYALAEAAAVSILPTDIVIIFHAGVGNDIFKEINNTPHDIPSLSLSEKLFDRYAPSWNNANRSIRAIILPETASQEGLGLAINGLVVANIGTQLGLLDLIDPVKKSTVVGPWALEDRGLFNAAGLLPSIPSAFNRMYFQGKLDSLPAIEIASEEQVLELSPENQSSSSFPKVLKITLNTNEYLLVEYRRRATYNNDSKLNLDELVSSLTPINQTFLTYKEILKHPDFSHSTDFTFSDRGVLIDAVNFDAAIPHSGIAIWHVDDRIVKKYATTNQINRDSRLRGVRFLEADGVDNYSTGGDGFNDERYDVFYQGNNAKYYQNILDDNSFPSAKSNYEAAHSGLKLSNFSVVNETMSFSVSRNENFNQLSFPREIDRLWFRNDSSFAAAQSADSIWLYKKALNDKHFSQVQLVNPISLEALFLGQINTHAYLEKSTTIVEINTATAQISQSFAKSAQISQVVLFTEEIYFLDSDNKLFRIKNNTKSLIAENITSLFKIGDKLFFNDTNASLLFLNNGIVEQIAKANDAVIELASKFYSLAFSENHLRAFDSNDVLLGNFPVEVDYRYENGTIEQLWQFENYLVTRDRKNIIKITAINKANNNNVAVYGGFQPLFLHLDIENEIISFADSKKLYEQKIKLPAQKAQVNLPSGLASIDKKNSYLWPNPNTAEQGMFLRLQTAKSETAKIRIFTEIGQLKKSFSKQTFAASPTDIALPVSELANGTYFIQIEVAGQTLLRKATVIH